MSSLDTLAPDQRAVLELVLRQGRSYGELAEMLEIPERDVRARADAGLRALAGEPAEGVDSGRVADWLLGQQREADAARTAAAVSREPAAREWAAVAAGRLRELGGATIPEVPAPAEAAAPIPDSAAAPTPDSATAPTPDSSAAATAPRSSKLGGAVLLGFVAVVVVAGLVAVFALGGDDDDPGAAAPQTPTPTATARQAANDIVLTGRGDSDAAGLMRLFRRDDGTVQFAIAAENVPPNSGRETYAVWFTRDGGDARRLGFAQTQVGEDGVLTTGGPQQGDEDRFPRWFASYDKVLVTRETDANGRRPGTVVLEGTLPGAEG
jgi:hypothetical protein